MNTVLIILGAMALIAIMIIFYLIGIYNSLVRAKNVFKNAFAQIDVQLKRRYDLIPNLLESVKGYMKHEKETLDAVIKARNQASQINIDLGKDPADPALMDKLNKAEGALSQSLGKMFALSEAYPDLKADSNINTLMEELTSTENKIGFARQAYNDSVMRYNILCEEFPSGVIAGMFQFKLATLFEIEDPEEKKSVKVSFD
jgi:LemA protein